MSKLFTKLTGQETTRPDVSTDAKLAEVLDANFTKLTPQLSRLAEWLSTDSDILLPAVKELATQPHGELATLLSGSNESEVVIYAKRQGWIDTVPASPVHEI